jgi:signal transduction histidine kinase
MTALELVSFINQVLFVGLFVAAVRHAFRERTRASFNTMLLFGSIAGVVIVSRLAAWTEFNEHPVYPGIAIALLGLAPFAMVRLVDDFSDSPAIVQIAGAGGFVLLAILGVTAFGVMEQLVELAAIAFFVLVGGYAASAFAREAVRTRGITRRRMTAVAIGALLFIGAIVAVFFGALVRELAPVTSILAQVAALIAAVSFFFGFAPPAWVRRAWREPDLRRFLERSIHLAGVADERAAIAELNHAAAAAFGASGASVGIADEQRGVLRYVTFAGEWVEYPDDAFLSGRAYRGQRRVASRNAAAEDPGHAEVYEQFQARAVIAAPISTEARRLGVLTVYADRMSIFAEDDLWLLDLLADQCAVLLEARMLTEHASALRAREEAARLKEEFLSAAAHDLRTPLTVILGQAELLERRRQRNPTAPADEKGLARIAREARRLSDLVTELLDAQRLEQGGAIMDLAPGDLLEVIETVQDRYSEVSVSVDEPTISLVAAIDRPRVEQVLDNLIENALKYGADGPPPELRVVSQQDETRVSVIDHGIGIPAAERDRIFERFFRASNAQSITDTGLGLGLYICRRIVEEHGGRIWLEPTPGGGTTFSFTLPLLASPTGSMEKNPTAWRPAPAQEAAADA